METYLIVIGKTPTGYSVHCPDVPGCAAVGATVDQVMTRMKDALELHFEGMIEDGDSIPRPSSVDSYRDILSESDVHQYLLAHVQIDTSRFAAAVGRN